MKFVWVIAPPSLEAVISDYEGDDSGEVQPLPRAQSQSSMTLIEDESDGGGEEQQQPAPVSKKGQNTIFWIKNVFINREWELFGFSTRGI